MPQDYTIQINSLHEMKGVVLSLIESLEGLRTAYNSCADSCRQFGLPVQVYESFKGQNTVRFCSAVRSVTDAIQQTDLPWIANLIDGYETAMNVAGGTNSDVSSSQSAPGDKPVSEQFRNATKTIESIIAMQSKKDADGQPQNQRDMTADFIAAQLAQLKSR